VIRLAARIDRVPANHHERMTASPSPYLPLLIGIAWAAPMLARELESGTAALAWSLGVPPPPGW
jgi:hypothetical protein